MGIKKGWTGLPFEYIGFSDLPNLAKERGLSVGLDLYGSFFGAILTRSQAYVSSTLLALSNAIGDKFFVVEDGTSKMSIQKAIARESRFQTLAKAVEKYQTRLCLVGIF